MRPLFILENGDLKITHEKLEEIVPSQGRDIYEKDDDYDLDDEDDNSEEDMEEEDEGGKKDVFRRFYREGYIELLDVQEEENAMIAFTLDDLKKKDM